MPMLKGHKKAGELLLFGKLQEVGADKIAIFLRDIFEIPVAKAVFCRSLDAEPSLALKNPAQRRRIGLGRLLAYKPCDFRRKAATALRLRLSLPLSRLTLSRVGL